MGRHTREDVIVAASRMFAAHGYHATSMRDLGTELGILGGSLYAHVNSKEELLVEVVERASDLFGVSAANALETPGTTVDRLHALVSGHIDVVLDYRDEVKTFLNEANALDPDRRRQVIAARDGYEATFIQVLEEGQADGSFVPTMDVRLAAILTLSMLNAIDRWFRDDGRLSRLDLANEVLGLVLDGYRTSSRPTG